MSQGDFALALSLHDCCPLSRRRDSLLSKTGFRGYASIIHDIDENWSLLFVAGTFPVYVGIFSSMSIFLYATASLHREC